MEDGNTTFMDLWGQMFDAINWQAALVTCQDAWLVADLLYDGCSKHTAPSPNESHL